ncbi:MAG: lysylphosphatidylglycerol synthase transmembrane domain-containing protein [Phototrophicales bacterium]
MADKLSSTLAQRPRQSKAVRLIAVGLAVVLLVLAFRHVNWDEMLGIFQNARLEYLLMAFLMMMLSYFFRGLRWRVLLSAQQYIPPLAAYWAVCAGYLGNYFLPARAGELIRSVLINQRTNISTSFALATILTERIFDAALLVIIVLILLPTVGNLPPELNTAINIMTVFSIISVIGLFLAAYFQQAAIRLFERLPIPAQLKEPAHNMLNAFFEGLKAFQNKRRAVQLIIITGIIWTLDVILAVWVANALNLPLGAKEVLFLLAALGLSSAIPSTPGYIGVYHFVTVSVLGIFGLNESQALSFIIAFQGITYLLVIIWGTTGIWRLSAKSPS